MHPAVEVDDGDLTIGLSANPLSGAGGRSRVGRSGARARESSGGRRELGEDRKKGRISEIHPTRASEHSGDTNFMCCAATCTALLGCVYITNGTLKIDSVL